MAFTETFLFTVVAIFVVCVTHGNVQATTIDSLRRGYNFGTNGKFLVPRQPLEQRMKELGAEVSEATFVSSDRYDTEKYAEVVLLLQHGHDVTLQMELDHEQLEGLTTGSHFLTIGIPFTTDDEPGVLMLNYFTNNQPVFIPHLTNHNVITNIDSIVNGDNGLVTLHNGDDVMEIYVHNDEDCIENGGEDSDFVGNKLLLTNYPMPFDWGCDRLGDDVSFCRTLAPYMDDITAANGDVCTEVTTVSSQKCSAEMEIRNMTGIFRDAAPFLADTVPSAAVGAAWVDRGHSFGLVFPCF